MPATPSQGMTGYGAKILVEKTPGAGFAAPANYIDLGEIINITPPNAKTDQAERTHMQSPDATKEFVGGLTDLGEMSYDMNHIPGSATNVFCIAWRRSRANLATRIVYPNGEWEQCPAFPTGYAPKSFGASAIITATLTLKVAGAETFSSD